MPRGGGRGGRGRGRGGRGGSSMVPAMGLSFADIQNLSREATALYPVCSREKFIVVLLIQFCPIAHERSHTQ